MLEWTKVIRLTFSLVILKNEFLNIKFLFWGKSVAGEMKGIFWSFYFCYK